MRNTNKILKFPEGFLWGAATAAYQVEGGISNNDWAQEKRIAPAKLACDHYRRYTHDFQIARELHHNAHRLSLEWSRIEPEEGKWNEKELQHYHDVLELLRRMGFKVFVTLHHFTNPVWIAKLGGWESPKTAEHFEKFTGKVAQSLGHLIDYWITVNEPNVYSFMSYIDGVWPPFKKNIFKAERVYRNLLDANNRAYKIIHTYYPEAAVGFAQNISMNEPLRYHSTLDKFAAKFATWTSVDFALRRTKYDFIGLNHYLHNRVKFSFKKIVETIKPAGAISDKGWEIYPEAIYHVLAELKKFGRPIYVTENGIADAKDLRRADFIVSYLAQIHRAIQSGSPVRGYLYWSLLDNYEWPVTPGETGYESKFGLVEVNFKNQERRIRESARVYAEICRTNSVDLAFIDNQSSNTTGLRLPSVRSR